MDNENFLYGKETLHMYSNYNYYPQQIQQQTQQIPQ